MNITYRTRRRLQRIGIVALALLAVGILIWFCWVIWVERHVVYTKDGATLNFDLSEDVGVGQIAQPPSAEETVPIYYNEGENTVNSSTALTQISGYYVTGTNLSEDIAGVRELLSTLPSGSAVMIDMKNAFGGFYYSSDLPDAASASSVDAAAVDNLLGDLMSRDLYLIAKVPAFRDRNYGLNHVSCGLPIKGGGGVLWSDDDSCYWLDPTDSETLNWLRQVTEELKGMGFDEVVFSEFRFPDTDRIIFDGDKEQAIRDAAASIVSSCATDNFAVSFIAVDATFPFPEGRSRIYLQNVSASNAGAVAAQFEFENPAIRLVFMATSNDTRFNEFSVVRPLETMDVVQ